jgi:hypothetical protein
MNEQHDAPRNHGAAPDALSVSTDPATYREYLGTIFSVDQVDQPDRVELRLAEVGDERVGGGIQQFSLFFHGPASHILPQGTYSLHHDALGSIALFIVPIIGSNQERIVYQACFSRLAPPTPGKPGH